MENIDTLRKFGLFDAKVPRYTSYPPANYFENGIGRIHQENWLNAVPSGEDVSIYIHIPFCKRLCWFCACRTQGTSTLRPVEAYVDLLLQEIKRVRGFLSSGVKMARLHLGGGTPTILPSDLMTRLLSAVFEAFACAEGFEFSVEIDPTEACEDLLSILIGFGLNRASLGVQDFAPVVQAAIGRLQTHEQTERVVSNLRGQGLSALNLDLLYGLPHQTIDSFQQTLDRVIALKPDRLAIYGYAHVPWMSKRQVMIREADLPDTQIRFELSNLAGKALLAKGYHAVGIDHFALKHDALYIAQNDGRVRRNFQGYTDDPCQTLIGFGASAISRFPQGYLQNAPATSIYQDHIAQTGLAAQKGYMMDEQDEVIAHILEELLCRFDFRQHHLLYKFPQYSDLIETLAGQLKTHFENVFEVTDDGMRIAEWAKPLVRVIASFIDRFSVKKNAHSAAI